jgi:hypothetical protein
VPTVQRSICALLVTFALAPAVPGADEPKTGSKPPVSITVLSGTSLTFEPAASPPLTSFHLPVSCTPPDQFPNLTYQTLSILLNGQFRDPAAAQVKRDENERTPFLLLTIDPARLVEPGRYEVRVQPLLPDPAAPLPAALLLNLTRPGADLLTVAPLQIERVIYLPWCWDRLTPGSVLLVEKSNRSGLSRPAEPWLCDLRGWGGRPAGRLRMTVPDVAAGSTGSVSVEVVDPPQLGKSVGVLTVRSPQLTNPEGSTFTIEVTTRAASFWIVVFVALGIFGGYYARTVLENRKQLLLAKAAGEDTESSLDGTIANTTDAPLLADLTSIRDGLRTELRKRGATPESVQKATQDARQKADARLKTADDARAALLTRITDLKAAFAGPDAQPAFLALALRDALPALDRAEAELNSGIINRVSQDVTNLVGRVADVLLGPGREWQARTAAALQRFGTWPEASVAEMTTTLGADVAALPPKLGDVQAAVVVTSRIANGLRHQLFPVGVDNLITYGTDIVGSLEGGSKTAAANLGQTALEKIQAARDHATADDFRALAEAVHDFQGTLTELIGGLAKEANAPVPADSGAGRYLSAIRSLVPQKPGAPTAPSAPAGLAPQAFGLPPLAQLSVLRIEPSATPVVGRPVEFRLQLVSASGQTVPTNAKWYQDGRLVKEGPDALTYTPQRVGEVRVRAEVTVDGVVRAAEVALPVRAPEPDAPTGAERALRTTERLQSAISGTIIAFTGYLLFQGGFIGTAEDLGVAFLWGFSVDLGLSRIRDLANPLVMRGQLQTPRAPAPPMPTVPTMPPMPTLGS